MCFRGIFVLLFGHLRGTFTVLSQPPAENLVPMEQRINWSVTCGLADKAAIREVYARINVNAYVYMSICTLYCLSTLGIWKCLKSTYTLPLLVTSWTILLRLMEEMNETLCCLGCAWRRRPPFRAHRKHHNVRSHEQDVSKMHKHRGMRNRL